MRQHDKDGADLIKIMPSGGVESIEHGTFMSAQNMKLMKEHGTWYVPTLIAGQYVMEKARKDWYPPQIAAKAEQAGAVILATAGNACRAGEKIAFGTDAGVYPHGENAKEFQYMVQAGMPPVFVRQAAATACCRTAAQTGPVRPDRHRPRPPTSSPCPSIRWTTSA